MSLELVLVRARQLCKPFISKVVGAIGFEPTTSWSQTRRSTKLSYTPLLPVPRTETSRSDYARPRPRGKQNWHSQAYPKRPRPTGRRRRRAIRR